MIELPENKNKEEHSCEWELVEQITLPLLTYLNRYRCKICFHKKEEYENPVGTFTL